MTLIKTTQLSLQPSASIRDHVLFATLSEWSVFQCVPSTIRVWCLWNTTCCTLASKTRTFSMNASAVMVYLPSKLNSSAPKRSKNTRKMNEHVIKLNEHDVCHVCHVCHVCTRKHTLQTPVPVSPVAPPNSTTRLSPTKVVVWPNLARGKEYDETQAQTFSNPWLPHIYPFYPDLTNKKPLKNKHNPQYIAKFP